MNESDVSGRATQAWGLALYALSTLPNACSNVYREHVFRNVKMDIFYLMFWVVFLQLLLSFLTIPILAAPIFGGTPLDEIPGEMLAGLRCFAGLSVREGSDDFGCEKGVPPGVFLFGYVVLNFLVSLLRLLLIKRGSATLLQITNAIALLARYVCRGPLFSAFFPLPVLFPIASAMHAHA